MADELDVIAGLSTAMDSLTPDARRRALAYLADRYGAADHQQFGFGTTASTIERSEPVYAAQPEVDLRDDRSTGGYRSRPARPGSSLPKLPSGPGPGARRRETPITADRSET